MSRAFFFAHYSAWGLIWAHVLVYYALFAHKEWRVAGGRWRDIPREGLQLIGFILMPVLRDGLDVARRRPLAKPRSEDYRYTKAHRMGFFITLAAVTYALMGLAFAHLPDRTAWPTSQQVLSVALIGVTSVAGLGHLFTALEHSPRRWRYFVVAIAVYYPVSMLAYGLVFPA